MLLKLYPKVHRRYTSLPVLGPIPQRIRDVATTGLALWRSDASILTWLEAL